MASAALKVEPGVEIPGEDEGAADAVVQTTERDFEAEAREHGWAPKDEFKGDSARWVDAETFMKRADEMMPLLKAQNARQKREIDSLKKDFKRLSAHLEGAEKRAYDKAVADLETRHDEAVESGDTEAAKAALKEMRDLKPAEPSKTDAELKAEAEDAFDSFRETNNWYDKANLAGATETEQLGRIYFDRMLDKHIAKTKEMAPAEYFQMITDLTLEKYPQLKAKPAREKPQSPVEGGGSGRPRGSSKSWDNLPEQARKQFERFQARGALGVKATGDKDKDLAASRAYYARSFDWEGFQA